MNKRQKKKRYKKIHGHNPPKDRGNQSVELPDTQMMSPETIERIAVTFSANIRTWMEALSKVAEGISKLFQQYAESVKPIWQQDTHPKLPADPSVVVAKALRERREKRCRKRLYKRYRR